MIVPRIQSLARLCGAALATTLALGWPSGASAGPSCGKAHARTVAHSGSAAVVARSSRPGHNAKGTTYYSGVYACRGSGSPVRLDDPAESGAVAQPTLAGRYLAYVSTGFPEGADVGYEGVVVMNLRTHRGTAVLQTDCYECGSFPSLVIADRGTVAFTTRGELGRSVQVCRSSCLATEPPQPQILDQSSDIDPQSLRLRGDRFVWRVGGVGRSAPIQ